MTKSLEELPNSALKSDGAQARRRLTQRWADQTVAQGDRLQPVLDHCSYPDQPDPVRDRRAGPRWDPNSRDAVVLEEIAQVASVPPIRFRLMDRIASDECREGSVVSGGLVTVQQPKPTNSGRPLS